MVKDLSNEERILLFRILRLKEEAGTFPSNEISENKPTWSDLKKLALCQSLPFIGFGFLDNLIMIVAGEYIDGTTCIHTNFTYVFLRHEKFNIAIAFNFI